MFQGLPTPPDALPLPSSLPSLPLPAPPLPSPPASSRTPLRSQVAGGEYEYEVCLYSRATQRGRGKGKAAFSLGREWAWETAGAVGVLRGGDKCGAGPKRSVRITFECAESEKLGPVSERSTCAYATTLATPAAC
ncbi:hypothetical protein EMIHUDRAFT_78643 [Emiliania huxleyi CCMP1516]|uniref:MRH domain-containing protein n=2 Tax=Emiliania huxleyi TaxID=2903 RepID=A0A0D3IM11_EMIH1|nr:hypothetical protein EMIHUDRAFT_78643 [Emiliania huxleyi CCMP1516]EOD12296.1 hypothetical protein EMIHUDRAFT_78643 [Emiliania huxleyi CCMP1516]|eukprot:XP_005764725.1 hypothetical protein EMIHUDRAFT_78643 [Emiliania huxleyi CCMP1516]